jgi:peptide/nickel transport system substrate-binding protein
VRQAIAFALDKQEIVNAVRWGAGEPTNQIYPKDSAWYFDVEDRKRDLATARRLMAEAGQSQGFTLPMMVRARTMPTAQVLQAQLKMIGIRLEFEQMDTPTRLARQRKWEFDSDLRGEGYPLDPENTFRYYYSKIGFRNYSGYNNPEYDQMYEKALVEQDFKKRKQLYLAMMRLLQRDVPEMFLNTSYRYVGLRESVKGFEPDVAGMNTYSDGGIDSTWIDRP